MNRRYFITGLTTIGLSSCQFLPQSNTLKIEFLSNSIPGVVIKNFQRSHRISVTPKPHKNYSNLLSHFNQSSPAILGIGDAWLASVVSSLQEIDPKQIPNLNLIPPRWRSVGILNDKLYAVPYRWGATVVVYNQNKFKQKKIPPINAWQDLWHPQLRRRISLPDNVREVIGLCSKRRGFSYNENKSEDIKNIIEDLLSLDGQTLSYTSNYYVQSLVNEDTWVAVGWSGEFQEIVKRYPQFKIIYPQEGTALWFDCWTIPKNSSDISSGYQWINYCLQSKNSHLITLLTNATGIVDQPSFLTQSYLDRCEPILPLPQAIDRQYQKIWQDLRQKT